MIHQALQFLTQELDRHIRLKTDTTDANVFLTNVAHDGVIVIPSGAIGVSLVNIEEERVFKDQRMTVLNDEGIVERVNPEIKLNLYMMIAANFQMQGLDNPSVDYIEGLKRLSYVIQFFQARNVFTHGNSPGLAATGPALKKLVVELYSYSFEQMHNVWSLLGNVYLPSVLYRVRMIVFQEREISGLELPVERINLVGGGI